MGTKWTPERRAKMEKIWRRNKKLKKKVSFDIENIGTPIVADKTIVVDKNNNLVNGQARFEAYKTLNSEYSKNILDNDRIINLESQLETLRQKYNKLKNFVHDIIEKSF